MSQAGSIWIGSLHLGLYAWHILTRAPSDTAEESDEERGDQLAKDFALDIRDAGFGRGALRAPAGGQSPPPLAQSLNYGPRTALVGQEIHASGLEPNRSVREQHHFLVGHARRAVGDRRPDVLGR